MFKSMSNYVLNFRIEEDKIKPTIDNLSGPIPIEECLGKLAFKDGHKFFPLDVLSNLILTWIRKL